jgi:hypothetical protein
LNESPAWLLTLLRVAKSEQMEAALLRGQVTLAATAATVSKEGGRMWQKVARQLEKEAKG